jgi:uncharacterized protein (TIGR02145 family)
MKKLYFILTIILLAVTNITQAQNDSIYFWKSGVLLEMRSIKTADLDSITFKRPTSINIAGPIVTDIDGNTYQSVTNCGLTFTKQNLNVSKYSDGTPIPQVQNASAWANLTTGAWCYYENNTANGTTYGKLYNWYAVAGIYDAASAANPALRKKLAPIGWHIPSNNEWTQLTDCLGGTSVAGGKMKSTGTIQEGNGLWQSPNLNANNISGFNGLPGGNRGDDGNNYFITGYGNWWSSTMNNSNPWSRALAYNNFIVGINTLNSKYGFSVRLIKD